MTEIPHRSEELKENASLNLSIFFLAISSKTPKVNCCISVSMGEFNPNHHGYTERWNSNHPMGGPAAPPQQVGGRREEPKAKESLD